MKNMLVFEEHAKWLVLQSDMEQAVAVIASDIGNVPFAIAFGDKQRATTAAATTCASRAKTTEIARAYMEVGKIMIIDQKPAAAEEKFNDAVTILKALPGYHKLHLYTFLHGLGWVYLLKRQYQKAEDCFSEALSDRAAAYGVDDIEGVQ